MTNYEKIKSMSIEEMALALLDIEYRARILGAKRFDELIDWLESEVENNDQFRKDKTNEH